VTIPSKEQRRPVYRASAASQIVGNRSVVIPHTALGELEDELRQKPLKVLILCAFEVSGPRKSLTVHRLKRNVYGKLGHSLSQSALLPTSSSEWGEDVGNSLGFTPVFLKYTSASLLRRFSCPLLVSPLSRCSRRALQRNTPQWRVDAVILHTANENKETEKEVPY